MDSDDGEICICSHCAVDGLSQEACSFCYNCKKYFCSSCNVSHGRFFASHKTAERKELQKLHEIRSVIQCEEHGKEKVELYCPEHESVLCKLCRKFKHRKCDVIPLAIACENANVEKDFIESFECLYELNESAKSLKEQYRFKQNAISRKTENLRNDIQELREGLDDMLSCYEKQLKDFERKNEQKVTGMKEAYEYFVDRIGSQLELVGESRRNLDRERLFVRTVQTKQTCVELRSSMENIESDVAELDSLHLFDERLPSCVRQLCNLGNDEVDEVNNAEISFTSMKKPELITITKEYDVRVPGDEEFPLITGCSFLTDNLILLCDNSNRKLKTFQTNTEAIFEAPVPDGPFDVARAGKNKAIESVPNVKCVQLVTVDPDIEIEKQVGIGHKCYGVAVHNEYWFVCVADPDTNTYGVQMLSSEEETVIKFIGHFDVGHPGYVDISNDGCAIYYGGGLGATAYVKCVTKDEWDDGSCFTYKDAKLNDPKSIIVDTAGNALICDKEANIVEVISVNEGKSFGKILLCGDDNICQPTSMCMNRKQSILVVASHDIDKRRQSYLSFFKLERI